MSKQLYFAVAHYESLLAFIDLIDPFIGVVCFMREYLYLAISIIVQY